ncbi:hypothetical protein COHA_001609 [Chlorella ohadii]|uniref:Protein kinase domain-containing protein n=1 Tax=Chlorella ohadii TaxID=2649997 RepID=A0AAD5DWJ9_9CHLO|nr:hypothetical protein COHA_001609 [Chlorella ohadii]
MPRVLLPECMQGVELGPLLGTGANGRTYIARWQGSRVAVKCVELREREPEALPEYAQQAITGSGGSDPGSMALVEAVLSKALRHPHIVTTHTYGVRESGRHMGTRYKEVWIVQDLCTMGPLIRAVEQGRFKNELGAPRLLFVVLTAAEVAGALAYLHSKGVVHGDLSSNNVLLNSSTKDQRRFVALVSDFGLARPLEVLTQLSTDTYGTISFMPPELVLNQKLSPAVDIYSFGVLLWEMMSGCRAWADMSSLQILAAITTGRQLQVSDSWPRRIQSLISRCLDSNPKERPSATAVLEELELMLAPRQ